MEKEHLNCSCGNLIYAHDLDYRNASNEEGEDYYTVSVDCPECGKEYNSSNWGHCEDIYEALDELKQKIESSF